jgi:hypothetical protein
MTIDDAATVFECFEYWVKLSNGEVKAVEDEPPKKKSAKSVVQTMKTVDEDDEEDEDEPLERLITVKKGKHAV